MNTIKSGLSKRLKKSGKFKNSKISHSKIHCKEKALNYIMSINITPQKNSFVSKNCFKLLFYT